jgi:hypothetical protein
LNMILTGASLNGVLRSLASILKAQAENILCSI